MSAFGWILQAAMSGIGDGSTVAVESLDDMPEAVTRLHEDWQLWENTRNVRSRRCSPFSE